MRNPTDEEKARIAKVVGEDLVSRHGRQKYYAQRQVKKCVDRHGLDVDVACWAYCFFMDHDAFDAYHQSIGETCDYVAMKSSMVSAVTDHASDAWFDFDWDLSWLEWPDVDLSSIFDFIDF